MELTKDVNAYLKLRKKLMVLEYARRSGSVAKALKEFKVPKATYYKWKKIYDKDGEAGLLKKHPVAYNHPNKIKEEIIEKVLFLRKDYQLGSWRTSGTWSATMTSQFPSRVFPESLNATVLSACRKRQHAEPYIPDAITNRHPAITCRWM